MYWFILLFPLLIFPWGYDPFYTFPKVAYLDLFVLGTWLYVVLKRKYRSFQLGKPAFSAEWLVLIFLGLAGLSTIFSVNKSTSLYGTEYRYEGLLTLFSYCSVFLFSYKLLDEKRAKKVIPGMAVVSIIVSFYGILQHYLVDFLPRNSSKIGTDRSYAFFDNPNFFGSYLVLMIMLAVTMYLLEKNRLSVFYFFTSCCAFVALIFSGTRSGWVGTFMGVLFLSIFVVLKRKGLWKKWSALLLSFVLIIAVINSLEKGSYVNRINSVVTDSYQIASNQSTGHEGSNRFFIWEKAFPLLKTYFLIGSGPDTLQYVFKAKPAELEQYFGSSNVIVDKAHNEYLQMAITLGLPALIIYLLLVSLVVIRTYKAARDSQGNDKIFFFGLLSVIFGYLVQAFFNISVVPVAPLYWSVLGMTLARSELYLQKNQAAKIMKVHNQSA